MQESLQLDYANVALDHLNSLEPATRRLRKIALNETTLTQFAFACASRVLIDEPMTVKEALASEHADEWQAFSGQAYAASGGTCPLSCRRYMARKAGPLFVFLN